MVLGSLVGATTGSVFILANSILTRDSSLDLWEFGVTLSIPCFVAVVFNMATKTKFTIILPVSYLTFFMPILGAVFGASGAEPFWQVVMLGFVGGLGGSIPFAFWRVVSTR